MNSRGQWIKFLSISEKSWKCVENRSFDTGLEVLEHCYKMIDLDHYKEREYQDTTIPGGTNVIWGFKVKFYNPMDKPISFYGKYYLYDEDGFEITNTPLWGYSYKTEFRTINPGEEMSVQMTSSFGYGSLDRVDCGSIKVGLEP